MTQSACSRRPWPTEHWIQQPVLTDLFDPSTHLLRGPHSAHGRGARENQLFRHHGFLLSRKARKFKFDPRTSRHKAADRRRNSYKPAPPAQCGFAR